MPRGGEGIPINRRLVTWARERAGISQVDATSKFPHFPGWEDGSILPTYPQLEKLAEEFKLPVAVFFFPDPPPLPPIRESFRTLPETEFDGLPRTVRMLLLKAKAFQLNLAEMTQGVNPGERSVQRDLHFHVDVTPEAMAATVRDYLGVSLSLQRSWSTDDIALKAWRKALQDAGVFVFKEAFKAEGFFGFSLYDEVFPIVYVNNSATKTRQIFTMLHELAHILFHTSGIDVKEEGYITDRRDREHPIEVLCNRFAAEILVPRSAFNDAMQGQRRDEATAERLAALFNVSREVIYRKFLDRRWITQAEYRRATDAWNAQRQEGGGGSGGNYYNTKIAYLGREYISLAFKQFYQNKIDGDQLAEYLDTKPKNVSTLEQVFVAGAS